MNMMTEDSKKQVQILLLLSPDEEF